MTAEVAVLFHMPEKVPWRDLDALVAGVMSISLDQYEQVAVALPTFYFERKPEPVEILDGAREIVTNVCGRANWRASRRVRTESQEKVRSISGGDILVHEGIRYLYGGRYGNFVPLIEKDNRLVADHSRGETS